MKTVLVMLAALALGTVQSEASDETSGNGALALAALVGVHSPLLAAADKAVLARLLDGNLAFASNKTIKVVATSVTCRASDVDIAAHSCVLRFGAASRTLNGRVAHELFATLVENGIASDGAAGSIFEAVGHLACTVNTRAVKERGGGGAGCTYDGSPGS